jgi:hypothetical protein
MAIAVTCGQCCAKFKARDTDAGKRGKCPKCSGPIAIPAQQAAAVMPKPAIPKPDGQSLERLSPDMVAELQAAAAVANRTVVVRQPKKNRKQLQAEILAALAGQIEPVTVSWTYRFAIFLVAIVMVLLPVIYVALIALVGYGMYCHAVYDTGILGLTTNARAWIFLLLAYLAPLVAGTILIFFMFKPLLARPEKIDRRRSLRPDSEPLLFAFVERICTLVDAPIPKRIDVNCDLNASASFRHGWLSVFLPADLVLTIGAPLAAGLSASQFAGVLAHEFGHFTQGAGMRLTFVVRSISWWLTRAVYERDTWDALLDHYAANTDWRIALILQLARLSVWLSRRVLWVLMVIGYGVAGLMLRQMEFDADRFEARLVGSETFETTCRRLAVLGVATMGAFADLGKFFGNGTLADNLSKLVQVNLKQLPQEAHDKITEHIDGSKTGWLDTHPADSARIANARREDCPGIFHYDAPAAALFSDFDTLACNVSSDYYRGVFGSRGFKPSCLRSVEELIGEEKGEGA